MIDSWIKSFYQFLDHWGYNHPIHPALVHLPMGLVMGAFILGWVAFLFRKEGVARSARHCLILAFLFWFPVVFSGYMDWQHFYGRAWITPAAMMLVLSVVLGLLLLMALVFGRKGPVPSRATLTIYTLGFITVVLLGYFGGQLVYERKTPEPSKSFLAGEKTFETYCFSCHPRGGNLIRPNKPIKNSSRLKDLETFMAWIRHPNKPMPPFPESQISINQTKELYAYLSQGLTLSK
jgi:uncharacterized membrane protein